MAAGPALVIGVMVFPLSRALNVLGRFDPVTEQHPDIDLAPLGLGLSVSRRHAEVRHRDDGFTVRDLGSRLGTLVNGEPLTGDEERPLLDGDTITVGSVTLVVDLNRAWPKGLVADWDDDRPRVSTAFTSSGTVLLVGQLPAALREGQLLLHYQPQVVLMTGEVDSVEALIRWEHPERGVVSPAKFVPAAEESGFIRSVTTFAITEAARQARIWRAAGHAITVSVNVSVRDLEDDGFTARVIQAMEATGAAPADLLLEVTESAVMVDPDGALEVMQRLRKAGFHLAIDDFGAGESSLGYLSRLPVHEVKLDQAFARDFGYRNEAIVKGAVSIAHDLGLVVVAEGIENESTAHRIRDLGCDKGQGYHFGRPVAAQELALG